MIKKLGWDSLAGIPPAMRSPARREADMDLLTRLASGSIIYPAMLLLIGLTTPYPHDHPRLFWPVVLATALALVIRYAVRRLRHLLYERSRRAFLLPLFLSVALTGGACGFLLLTVALKYGFASFSFCLVMMWMAGIASGSTISFTPSFPLLVLQLIAVLAPVTTYEFSLGTTHGLSLGLATLVFMAFHVVHGDRLSRMYWDLRSTRVLEKLRIRELEDAKSLAERAQQKLHYQATHDTLTGVMNHAQILHEFDRELQNAFRTGAPLGLLMLDLDHFKQVNDRYGHLGGDEVLRTVAARLRHSIRATDAVGRYGGEEFLILLPGCDAEDCAASAERIRQAIQGDPVTHDRTAIQVTASLGVSVLVPDAESGVRQMIARADKALYKAKRKGRNRVEFDSLESAAVLPSCG